MKALRRVVCGISGGVDSAVAAYLLKQKGYEVIGVFMKNWDSRDENSTCLSGDNDLQDAKSVCKHLDIELLEVSFVKDYWNDVFSHLLSDYENGMTPNPDINCNRFIKFGSFYKHAFDHLGADAIATGHYARTSFGPFLESYMPNQNVQLIRARDATKDQTLFLSQVHQLPLRRTMFPLGEWFKCQVRQLAEKANLTSVYKKKDSTGICFIGHRRFTDFIREYIPGRDGAFVDIDTKDIVGWHRGVHHWTIGQGCRIPGMKNKYYVSHRDPKTQTIFVASGRYHASLFSIALQTHPPHWISSPPLDLIGSSESNPVFCMFKFQHTEWTVPCRIWSDTTEGLRVELALPTRAITPGQFAVFYRNNVCLGSAQIISTTLHNSTSGGHTRNIITPKINEINDVLDLGREAQA